MCSSARLSSPCVAYVTTRVCYCATLHSVQATISVYIHAKSGDSGVFMKSIDPSISLDGQMDSFVINYFVDRSIQLVNQVRQWEICSGCDDPTFRDVWEACPSGEIDKNVLKECRYVETFRSIS